MHVFVFVYICVFYVRVCECEGVCVLVSKQRGNVCVNVDYSVFNKHLNFLGMFFFVKIYIRMMMYVCMYSR